MLGGPNSESLPETSFTLYCPHHNAQLWFRFNKLTQIHLFVLQILWAVIHKSLLRKVFESRWTRTSQTCHCFLHITKLKSGGTWIWIWIQLLLPSHSLILSLPQNHRGTLHLPFPMLLLRCFHLHDAYLSTSVWSNTMCNRREEKEAISTGQSHYGMRGDHTGPWKMCEMQELVNRNGEKRAWT